MVAPAPDEPGLRPGQLPWRRYAGVWPVLGALLLFGALAYAGVPSFRDQVAVSFTREEDPFVELFAVPLDNESHVGTTCLPGDDPTTTRVVWGVRSHLGSRTSLDFELTVKAGKDTYGPGDSGRIKVDPGETRTRVVDVKVPADQAFDIEVRLPSDDQYLLLHCGGPA